MIWQRFWPAFFFIPSSPLFGLSVRVYTRKENSIASKKLNVKKDLQRAGLPQQLISKIISQHQIKRRKLAWNHWILFVGESISTFCTTRSDQLKLIVIRVKIEFRRNISVLPELKDLFLFTSKTRTALINQFECIVLWRKSWIVLWLKRINLMSSWRSCDDWPANN